MRIQLPSQVAPATAETLGMLPPLTLFRVLAHAPTVLDPWLGMGGALLTTLDLDPVLRELVILQVAADAGCAYEARQHEEIGAGVGVTDIQARAIRDGDLVAQDLRSYADVLGLVREIVTNQSCRPESFECVAAQLTERQLVELLLVVGHYLGLAVLINALEIAPEAPDGLSVLGLPQRGADA